MAPSFAYTTYVPGSTISRGPGQGGAFVSCVPHARVRAGRSPGQGVKVSRAAGPLMAPSFANTTYVLGTTISRGPGQCGAFVSCVPHTRVCAGRSPGQGVRVSRAAGPLMAPSFAYTTYVPGSTISRGPGQGGGGGFSVLPRLPGARGCRARG